MANSTYEQSMLEEYFGQLYNQIGQYDQSQRIDILETVRNLIVEPRRLSNARQPSEVLADIRESIENGGRAALFFTTAFTNWYRRTEKSKTAYLDEYINLDLSNRFLFMEMMSLRDSGRWDDEELYQFEQYCLDKISD